MPYTIVTQQHNFISKTPSPSLPSGDNKREEEFERKEKRGNLGWENWRSHLWRPTLKIGCLRIRFTVPPLSLSHGAVPPPPQWLTSRPILYYWLLPPHGSVKKNEYIILHVLLSSMNAGVSLQWPDAHLVQRKIGHIRWNSIWCPPHNHRRVRTC